MRAVGSLYLFMMTAVCPCRPRPAPEIWSLFSVEGHSVHDRVRLSMHKTLDARATQHKTNT